jgi:hypothetical protein
MRPWNGVPESATSPIRGVPGQQTIQIYTLLAANVAMLRSALPADVTAAPDG